jgi:hypothetical protein
MSQTFSSTTPAADPNDNDGNRTMKASDLPDPNDLPELRIFSRSNIFYWWPLWAVSYVMAALTYVEGQKVALGNGREILVHPSSGVGITFLIILVLIMSFTNVKLRGIYSVVFILAIAFVSVLFGWLGIWDDIFRLIPDLTVFMNVGFYTTFGTIILAVWLARFFIFDRLVFWRLRPGQLTEERVIGGGEISYDTRGMLFEQHGDDFFRHKILGLGSGDLRLTTTGARKEVIEIPNVLFAQRKVRMMQRLIAVKPEEALMQTVR